MSDDSFKTIREAVTFEMKEKGSRFVCRAFPVSSRKDAESMIAKISKEHYDATHNCFAYCIGSSEKVTRFGDDGEPSGTAGKPILQAIASQELTNIVVIVTRYFGGTKLGTGGLIRAYGGVSAATLSIAQIKKIYLQDTIALSCSYQHLNVVMSLIEKYSGKVIQSEYGESILLSVQLRKKSSTSFIQHTIDQTSGRVKPRMMT